MGSQLVEQSVARSAEKTQEKRGNVQSSVPQSSSHKRGIVLRLTSQFLGERPQFQFQRALSRYILTKYRGKAFVETVLEAWHNLFGNLRGASALNSLW